MSKVIENNSVAGPLGEGQRWSAGRKREVVLRMLRGESVDALSRELNVEICRLEQWREKALSGIDESLKNARTIQSKPNSTRPCAGSAS